MNTEAILAAIAACATDLEVNALWTKTYLAHRDVAWSIYDAFQARKRELPHTPNDFKDNGWGWD
jgi:hypothetical protein